MNWSLPQDSNTFKSWRWEQIRPYYEDLEKRPLTEKTILTWLENWSQLLAQVPESERESWQQLASGWQEGSALRDPKPGQFSLHLVGRMHAAGNGRGETLVAGVAASL